MGRCRPPTARAARMTAGRVRRVAMAVRESANRAHLSRSWTERVLQGLGAHPDFTDSVLGDLAEEHARRTVEDGALTARRWYVREAARAVPHLLWNAARHGGPRGRTRAAAVVSAVALLPLAAFVALQLRDGPPAHLVIGSGHADGLIVNNVRPVQLLTRVLDGAGHLLPSTCVQYRWESGSPTSVTPGGVVTCTHAGDAMLRASLGTVATRIRLQCRPVLDVRAPGMLDLVAGGPPRDVPFEALGTGGRPVTLLAGQIAIADSTVVNVTGSRIRGRTAGTSSMRVLVGDRGSFTDVHVYEPVLTPERIRPDQHLAVSVRVAGGEMRQWRIPAGEYFIAIIPDGDEQTRPQLAVAGANCTQAVGHLHCQAGPEASVIAYHPQDVDPALQLHGSVVLWRLVDP